MSQAVTVVWFFALEQCGPCKHWRPQVERIAQEAKIPFVYQNLGTQQGAELGRQYDIRFAPTVIAVTYPPMDDNPAYLNADQGTVLYRATGGLINLDRLRAVLGPR